MPLVTPKSSKLSDNWGMIQWFLWSVFWTTFLWVFPELLSGERLSWSGAAGLLGAEGSVSSDSPPRDLDLESEIEPPRLLSRSPGLLTTQSTHSTTTRSWKYLKANNENICFLLQSLRTFPTGNKIPRIFESFLLHFLIKIYSLETINIISWCLGQCHTETKCLSRGLNPNHALITIFEDNHCTGSRYTPPVLESEETGVTAGRPLHTAWSTYDAVLGSSDSDKKLFLSHPRVDPLGLNTRNRTSFNEGFASAKTIKKTMTIKIKAS